MKSRYMIPTLATALAMAMSSCSTMKSTADKGSDAVKGIFGKSKEKTETVFQEAKTDAKDLAGQTKDATGKAITASKEAVDKVNEKLQAIAKEQERGPISGDWAIETVLGQNAVGETAPFIKFVPSEHRIYGNNGCNTLNADYTTDYVERTISFTNLATTMRLCPKEGITDVVIGQALGMTKTYTWDDENYEFHLYFYDQNGNQVMSLMHRDFQFLDGTWAVLTINGEKVGVKGMKLVLDVEQKRVHGNTGCNIINGDLDTDLETANSISFSGIAMTRMACPDSGWETRMIVGLEDAVTARKLSDTRIEFLGANGQQVMELERTTDTSD